MFFDTWNKTWCPFCKSINWFCLGDLSDMTAVEVEAVKCWDCKEIWDMNGHKAAKHLYVELGIKRPQ